MKSVLYDHGSLELVTYLVAWLTRLFLALKR
jgi:hypothetical protein